MILIGTNTLRIFLKEPTNFGKKIGLRE